MAACNRRGFSARSSGSRTLKRFYCSHGHVTILSRLRFKVSRSWATCPASTALSQREYDIERHRTATITKAETTQSHAASPSLINDVLCEPPSAGIGNPSPASTAWKSTPPASSHDTKSYRLRGGTATRVNYIPHHGFMRKTPMLLAPPPSRRETLAVRLPA